MSSQPRKQKASLPTQHLHPKGHFRLLHTLYMSSVWPLGLSEQALKDDILVVFVYLVHFLANMASEPQI